LSAGQAFEKFMEPQGFLQGTGGGVAHGKENHPAEKMGSFPAKKVVCHWNLPNQTHD